MKTVSPSSSYKRRELPSLSEELNQIEQTYIVLALEYHPTIVPSAHQHACTISTSFSKGPHDGSSSEGVLVGLLLALPPLLHLLLDLVLERHNRRIARRKLGRLLEILQRLLLVLLAHVGLRAPKVHLALVLVLDALNLQRLGRAVHRIAPLAQLVLQQRRVGVEGDFERVERGEQRRRVVLERRWVLVQVAQALLVLGEPRLDAAGFEGRVA